jgi:hypothetical protein
MGFSQNSHLVALDSFAASQCGQRINRGGRLATESCLDESNSQIPSGIPINTRGFKRTAVPLNRRMALVGTFELLPKRQTVGAEFVAGINTGTMIYANQVFSAEQDFVWLMKDQTIGRMANFLATLESTPMGE